MPKPQKDAKGTPAKPQQPALAEHFATRYNHFCLDRRLALSSRGRGQFVVCVVLLLSLAAAACALPGPAKRVSLSVPAAESSTAWRAPEPQPLRIAAAAILSPQTTSRDYEVLLTYLADSLDRPVQLVQRASYAETNELIRTRQVDVAFVCTGAYVQGHQEFGMELLAVPEVRGLTTYQSYIIVPGRSAAQELDDLRGAVFAYTDPMSLSGYLVPLQLLRTTYPGEADSFFSRTLFTYSHEHSLKAVSEGWVDGAAIDSLVYLAALAKTPAYGQLTRVIWQSPPYGIPPIVVSPALDPALKAQLRQIFFSMDDHPEGRRALSSLGIEQFVPADDSLYASARVLLASVGAKP